MNLAIIGGTGNLGFGLALRFAHAGHRVTIGSRAAEKAADAAAKLNQMLGTEAIAGLDNLAAAQAADVILIAVPNEAHEATLTVIGPAVAGKILVDATVPLAPGSPTKAEMPPEGSVAERTQRMLPDAKVVAAFHHVGAKSLTDLQSPVETDVMICGNDKAAKAEVLLLMEALGTRGIDCGPLRQAQALERITPLLIGLNIRYKKHSIGIRLTGL